MTASIDILDRQILNIAYSNLEDTHCPINTMEHYLTACKLGFNALKGDVRPTSDGYLVMCHDLGITLNEEGRITKFDPKNCKKILEMTLEELLSLEHEAYHKELGHYAHLCTFDQFAEICKEHGMICHPTLRDENVDVVIAQVLKVLKKYDMTKSTIVNSMTLSTLQRFREYNREIMLCYTLKGGHQITKEHVDSVIALENAVLDGFNLPLDNCYEIIEAAKDAIMYAKENDIRLFQAHPCDYKKYYWAIQQGFAGFHITRPILSYKPEMYSFKLVISDGKVKFENTFASGARYCADVFCVKDEIVVKNITLNGSDRGFADGIMPVWMEALPCQMYVKGKKQTGLEIQYSAEDYGIHILGVDLDKEDVLEVIIIG